MKRYIFGLSLCAAAFSFGAAALAADAFRLESRDLVPGQAVAERFVLDGFGCTGGNESPRMSWSGVPTNTKSLVLTVYDPDAPTGSGWWHWVVLDIPVGTTELAGGIGKHSSLPPGARVARNDAGVAAYMGPCPPRGAPAHRYVFTLHALNVDKLPVADDATPALIGFMTNAHRIGQTSFTVAHGR